MNYIDMILAIESGTLTINTMEELEDVKIMAYELSFSQGFYGRLFEVLDEITEDDLPIQLW